MVRSMFAGVAGLKAHQAKMDVIGNNIANVNTWGYKSGKMSFKDAMYQNTSSASGGTTSAGGYGGTNANQVGYGVVTGSISYDFSKGGMAPSSRGLDCMIDGSGFFMVGPMVADGTVPLDDEDALANSGLYLSRVGIFRVDDNGYLVDDGGNYVYGFVNEGDWTSANPEFNTLALAPIKIPTQADLAGVKDGNAVDNATAAKEALAKYRAELEELKAALEDARSVYMEAKAAYDKEASSIAETMPASTADPSTAITGIENIQKRYEELKKDMDDAYAAWKTPPAGANAADIAILKNKYDAARIKCEEANFLLIKAQAQLRAPNALADAKQVAAGAADPNWKVTWDAYEAAFDNYNTVYNGYNADPQVAVSFTDYALDPPSVVSRIPTATDLENAKTKGLSPAQKDLLALQKSLSAIEDGSFESKLSAAEQAVEAAEAKVKAGEENVKKAEQLVKTANSSITNTQVNNAGASDDTIAQLNNYTINKDGTIMGTSTDDNVTVIFGKIALIGVQNVEGLVKDNGYYYTLSDNCGSASVYEAGGTAGNILGNYLEQAKVDLADELTDMITTQRGFQANTKIITVTDQMLEELVNMKR